MAGRSGTAICGVRSRRRHFISLGAHATMFQAEKTAILACAKDFAGRNYAMEQIYIC
jgi:hypothetical protein